MPEEVKPSTPEMEPEIIVIPEEFYGGVKKAPPTPSTLGVGAAPAVTPSSTPTPAVAVKAPSTSSALGRGAPKLSLAAKLQQPPFLLRVIAIFLVVIIGAVTIYYINQGRQARQNFALQNLGGQVKPPEPVPEPPAPAPVEPPPAPPEPPPAPPPPVFPAKDYVLSADSDGDKVTDAEELIYNTDPQKPDTDSDGYVDSLEIENLYNPIGFKPERILPTGLVKVYKNSVFNYSIFHPTVFAVQTLDFSGREAIFTADTGEFAEVLVVDNPERLPLLDWYLRAAPGVLSSDLKTVTTKQKVDGLLSPDGLTAYFSSDDKIYAVAYNIGLRTDANFLTTFKMMLNSLRLNEPAGAVAPAPAIIESVAPTTTSEASVPEETATTP